MPERSSRSSRLASVQGAISGKVPPRINQGFVSNVPFVSAVIAIREEYRYPIVSALDDVMRISGNGNSRQPRQCGFSIAIISQPFIVGLLALLTEKFSDSIYFDVVDPPLTPQSSFFSQQRLTFGPLV
jgi:hypothetical protein